MVKNKLPFFGTLPFFLMSPGSIVRLLPVFEEWIRDVTHALQVIE